MSISRRPLTYLKPFSIDIILLIGCRTCPMCTFENMTYPIVGLKPKRYLLRQVLQLSAKPSRFWSQERAVNYYHGREKDEKDWREKEREKMTERKKKIRERLMREDFLVILWERARREFRRPVSWVHAVPLSLLSRSPPRVPPSQDAVLVVQRIPRMQQV